MDASLIWPEIMKMGSIAFLMGIGLWYLSKNLEAEKAENKQLRQALMDMVTKSIEQTTKSAIQTESFNKALDNIPKIIADGLAAYKEGVGRIEQILRDK